VRRRGHVEARIGAAAGVIWQQLAEHGATPVATLKQRTKLTEPVLLMALGWLAREGKLEFDETKRALRVALREPRV
jgi:hypothetical protein